LSDQLAKHNPTTGFDDAWRPVGLSFLVLKQSCGGLASVLPGTATIESDFSALKWEFDEYRSRLTEISLEGMMQCNQFKIMSSMQHSSPSTALEYLVVQMVNWYHKPGHSILSKSGGRGVSVLKEIWKHMEYSELVGAWFKPDATTQNSGRPGSISIPYCI
jgi:hypothetical protein